MRRGAVEGSIRDSLNSLRDSSGVDTAFVWLFSPDGDDDRRGVLRARRARAMPRRSLAQRHDRNLSLAQEPSRTPAPLGDPRQLGAAQGSADREPAPGGAADRLGAHDFLPRGRRARRHPRAGQRLAARRLGREPAAAAEAARQFAGRGPRALAHRRAPAQARRTPRARAGRGQRRPVGFRHREQRGPLLAALETDAGLPGRCAARLAGLAQPGASGRHVARAIGDPRSRRRQVARFSKACIA